jgi:hypothetical protein
MRRRKIRSEILQLLDGIEDRLTLSSRLHILEVDDRIGIDLDQPHPWFSAGRNFLSALSKLDDAADAVLSLHQLEAAVDLVERDPVGDEGVEVDLAGEVAVD